MWFFQGVIVYRQPRLEMLRGGTYAGRGYPVVHGQSYPVAAERTYPGVIEKSYPVLVGMSGMVYRVGVVRHGACGTKSE